MKLGGKCNRRISQIMVKARPTDQLLPIFEVIRAMSHIFFIERSRTNTRIAHVYGAQRHKLDSMLIAWASEYS